MTKFESAGLIDVFLKNTSAEKVAFPFSVLLKIVISESIRPVVSIWSSRFF